MAETDEIGTGSKVHKNDGQPATHNRLLHYTMLRDLYQGAKYSHPTPIMISPFPAKISL